MRHQRRVRAVGSLAVLGLVATACGGTSDAASETAANGGSEVSAGEYADLDPINVKVNTLHGPDNWMGLALESYTESITEVTGGAITFDYYYSNALLEIQERGGGLSDGLIDLAIFVPSWTPADFPIDGWISPLGHGGDERPVIDMLSMAGAMLEWTKQVVPTTEEWAASDLHALVPEMQVMPAYRVFCAGEPVTTLEEASGKRVRAAGEYYTAAAEQLGMVPTALAGPEIFESLQRGIVDCDFESEETPPTLSTWDVATEWTTVNLAGFTSFGLAMGKPFWDDLTPEHQQVFTDQLPVFLREFYTNQLNVFDEFYSEAPEHGVTFHEPETDLVEAIESFHGQIREQAIDTAPDAIDDPGAALEELESLRDEWATIVATDLGFSAETAETWPAWAEQRDTEVSADELQEWADLLFERAWGVEAP